MVKVAKTELLPSGRAADAYQEANTGAFAASEQCLQDLASQDDPLCRAWLVALLAQRWYAEPDAGELPSLEALEGFVGTGEDVRRVAVLACAEAAGHAVLTHDVLELQRWVELGERLSDGLSEEALPSISVCKAWLAVARGDHTTAHSLAEQAGRVAAQEGMARVVIEATAVRALCAEAAGDLEEATTCARRAVRMARAEDFPQSQYLASLVLARLRRLGGMPHLSARILRPLLAVAPIPWQGWAAWEALLAGALPIAATAKLTDDNDPSGDVRAFRALLQAGVEGDRKGFRAAATRLASTKTEWLSRRTEATHGVQGVDANFPADEVEEGIKAWCLGDESTPPPIIKGLCIDVNTDPGDPGPAAFVVAGPNSAARRIAGMGEPVVEATTRIKHVPGKSERTPRTLSAIALAGPLGISRDEIFRSVYGFDYEHNVHRELFKALIYRVRKTLGSAGEVRAIDADRFVLEPTEVIVIPDPRCEQSLEELMLKALAGMGDPTAQDAASTLGVPLRTAQTALKHLVDSGALETDRDQADKRLIRYRVEDTTFSEPTKWS